MKLHNLLFCFLLSPFILKAGPTPGQNNVSGSIQGSVRNFSPVEFLENQGQWDGNYKFKAITGRGDIYLQSDGFTYLVGASNNYTLMDDYHHGFTKTPPVLKFHSYKLTFVGANAAQIEGKKPEEFYCNFFLGNDPKRWKSFIHPFLAIDYNKLYNGIDMHMSSDQGNIKYEFVLAPGADASNIKMNYKGQDDLEVSNNNLIITTSVGNVTELMPYAYQYINDTKVEVPCHYKIKNNTVTFTFPKGYDDTKQLVIDPTVVFATFSGSTADNWGFTATYDVSGNFYNGGIVHVLSGEDFIETTGAFQTTYGGGIDTTFGTVPHGSAYADDIAIVKYNSSGSSRLWATYLGGSDNEQPHSMIVNSDNELIVAGRTYSNNFPTTTGAYKTARIGGADIIITHFNSTGSGLVGSTYMGGKKDDVVNFHPAEFVFGNLKHNYGDDARSEVQVDRAGNIYVAGCTKSSDFPVTSSAFQSTIGDSVQDGVIFKMNGSLTTLIWSTFAGGSGDDAAYVLAFDTAQTHLYIAGATASSNFPTTAGTLHPTYQGKVDGFILKILNSSPYTLQKGTFIGTSDTDQVYGIQVDLDNNVYVMGQSYAGHYPVTSGVYSNAHSTQFVQKLDSNLSTSIYSTVFGSGDSTHTNISPVAFLVDTCQNVYISGWGGVLEPPSSGILFPPSTGSTNNMPITSDAAQSTTDGHDFYFIVLGKNASTLLYGTYMGGTGPVGEHVDGGTSRFDKSGVVYQAICGGCGGSSSFPTTSGAWSTGNKSSNCNEIALKIAFNLGAVKAKADVHPNAKGCAPFTVHFTDSSTDAVAYNWNFADGTAADTTFAPSHTFGSPGVYKVRFIAKNPNACKVLDTVFLTITVDSTSIHPAFTAAIADSCGPFQAVFTNTSTYSAPGADAFTKFVWLFGDSTSYTGTTPPVHTFKTNGIYTIYLVMIDTTACNSPDTVKQTIRFNSVAVTPNFTGPDSVCLGKGATYADASINATSYNWNFGDGTSTVSGTPVTHYFNTRGTFTITYIVGNPAACTPFDTLTRTIVVIDTPFANFSYTPTTPQTNIPKTFTNLSVKATSYSWDFGDGTNSTETNPVHLFRKTGKYNVCLTATNGTSSCPSIFCKLVQADVRTLVDVPTGFSPNGDGVNDILYVRGAAIDKMSFKIFNRWGQKIFESNDVNVGWDGTYNGKLQEMEVYAYVLDVVFIDGSTTQKKGNITLLR